MTTTAVFMTEETVKAMKYSFKPRPIKDFFCCARCLFFNKGNLCSVNSLRKIKEPEKTACMSAYLNNDMQQDSWPKE